MKERKIKIFLYAYINQSNAQNMMCMTLAKYLDKSKFEVYTLAIKHGNFKEIKFDGVNIFTCYYPVKLTQYFALIWGVYNCDIAFMARGNNRKFQNVLLKIFNKKSFRTVNNIIDDMAMKTALAIYPNIKTVIKNFQLADRSYSMTSFVKDYNYKRHNLITEESVLPPPTDLSGFNFVRKMEKLRGVVFMGNDMLRKGVEDFVNLSKIFNQLTFHIIGRDGENMLQKLLGDKLPENVKIYGMLNYLEISKILKVCQLHVLPSRSEGFPMGIIMAAAAGIPSITYHDYGAEEWINSYENGVVCKELHEIEDAMNVFLKDPLLLQKNRQGATQLATKYSAKNTTEMYEEVIYDLYNS